MGYGGRPTTYTQEVVEQAREYITGYADHGHAMPSIVGLAQVVGRARDTMHAWGNDPEKPEFSDILTQIKEAQELVLFNQSLTGNYNAAIAKLALGKHGYHDKVDNNLSGEVKTKSFSDMYGKPES
jgi:hypothetical protein